MIPHSSNASCLELAKWWQVITFYYTEHPLSVFRHIGKVIEINAKEGSEILCEYFNYKGPLRLKEIGSDIWISLYGESTTVKTWTEKQGKGYFFSYYGCASKRKKTRYAA
jgi:hypothetical protein